MNCGLLGRKLGHSYSPQIHAYLGDYSYELFEQEPDNLSNFLRNGQFSGLNVTIPYKKEVIPFCAKLSDAAQKLGVVNTIVRQDDGTLIGHNTDYFGFLYTMKKVGLDVTGKKVLVLGSGGASATAVAVLKELGACVITVSRTGENNYTNLEKHADAALIVNATPVGMYPDTGAAPVALDPFPKLEGVIDVIYNPARTALLLEAEKRGIVAENGLWMLVAQAKESAEWFTGKKISDDIIPYIYKQLCSRMLNIILIGMPGCGKSTVGKLLSEMTGKELIDADTYLSETAKMSIPDIIHMHGEDHFRKLETQALSELGKRSGLIIATGGGCVTRSENYPLLHQNGTIVWIQRDIHALPTEGRPLSQSGNLEEMFRIRKPMYKSFCDLSVINQAEPIAVAEEILSRLQQEV